ncbi:MAG TPA: glycosyltransferase family 4 protein [Terriglobales bacterium]|nr:glycosyltransferase family 4 protein [Terriglobales bacterium]
MKQLDTIPAETVELAATEDPLRAFIAPARQRRGRILFIVESGTDVRLVEGLQEISDLRIVARKIEQGREISRVPSVPVEVAVGPSSRVRFAELVFRMLVNDRHDYDGCLVQGYGMAAVAANAAAKITGKPTLMIVCSAIEEYYRCRLQAKDEGRCYRRAEDYALRMLARLNARAGGSYIVLSQHLESVVRSHGSRSDVRIIPLYGVDTTIFQPTESSRELLRGRLGLPTNGSLILSSSRVAPEKDTRALLRAMHLLREKGRNVWLLCLTGKHQEFLALARKAGIADRVIAVEAVHPTAELPAYYQAADVCVQASRAEGLGFSPLEALACGTPVVATAVGGLRETIIDGATGWTHQPGNAQDLAIKIAEALDDPEEAKRRALNGRSMVCREYERKKVFRELAEYLESALGAGS